MVFGFDNASNPKFCIDNNNYNFLEKRIFGRNFVADFGVIFFDKKYPDMDNLWTNDDHWWVEFMDE